RKRSFCHSEVPVDRSRPLVSKIVVGFALALAVATLTARPTTAQSSGSTIEEYCRRAATIAPDDPDAWFELARWCAEKGLATEADALYRRTLALAPEHRGAREALGIADRETITRSEAAKVPSPTASEAVASAASVDGSSSDADASSESSSFGIEAPAPRSSSTPADAREEDSATEPTATAEAEELDIADAELAQKKEWARMAAETFRAELAAIENEDFLIHTTFPSTRDPKVRELAAALQATRNELVRLLGLRARGLFPSKLHVVFLRSAEELERFAATVDGRSLRRGDTAYEIDGRIVTHEATHPTIASVMAETALAVRTGNVRPLIWWVREGTGEYFAAHMQSRFGNEDVYKSTFTYAASALKAEGDNVTIYSIVEVPEYRDRERMLKRALAFTLVDFMIQSRKYRPIVTELRGESAPMPPPEGDEEAKKRYLLEYWQFQQKALSKAFGDLEKLQTAWKTYVARKAETFEPSGAAAEPRRTRRAP
ncbi:MAG TPA: hypothetical protein VK116_08155, partial [Planctomycetota bacterium]|nr:hypothetical protein [Planctomycetota bacterium]